MQESNNTFIKKLEEIKNKKTGMNYTFTVIKTTLEGINNRITEVEEEISGPAGQLTFEAKKQYVPFLPPITQANELPRIQWQ